MIVSKQLFSRLILKNSNNVIIVIFSVFIHNFKTIGQLRTVMYKIAGCILVISKYLITVVKKLKSILI